MISMRVTMDQARAVTVEYIAHRLLTMKQYLNDTQIAKYKFMLNEFATLNEMDEVAKNFNQAWPTDVTWDQ